MSGERAESCSEILRRSATAPPAIAIATPRAAAIAGQEFPVRTAGPATSCAKTASPYGMPKISTPAAKSQRKPDRKDDRSRDMVRCVIEEVLTVQRLGRGPRPSEA